jgi:tetratricopeptide (TPR) repeat protein
MIAKMYAEDKNPDGAKKIYGKIIQLDKENEPKWAGDSAGVYRDCEKPEQAVEIYNYIASIDQENKVKWFGEVGETWQKAKKIEQAVQTYNYIASIDQENKGKWFQKIAETWSGVEEYKKAIESWRKVIASTGETNHYKAIGFCYEKLKDIPKAIQSYRLSDDFPWAYFKMAKLHREQKPPEWKEALVLYNQARSFGDSKAQEALWEIGKTYEQMVRREQAIKSYQSICKLYPKSSSASRAHAHLQNKYKINITLGGAKEE